MLFVLAVIGIFILFLGLEIAGDHDENVKSSALISIIFIAAGVFAIIPAVLAIMEKGESIIDIISKIAIAAQIIAFILVIYIVFFKK